LKWLPVGLKGMNHLSDLSVSKTLAERATCHHCSEKKPPLWGAASTEEEAGLIFPETWIC
jgi:hypothetical protein